MVFYTFFPSLFSLLSTVFSTDLCCIILHPLIFSFHDWWAPFGWLSLLSPWLGGLFLRVRTELPFFLQSSIRNLFLVQFVFRFFMVCYSLQFWDFTSSSSMFYEALTKLQKHFCSYSVYSASNFLLRMPVRSVSVP